MNDPELQELQTTVHQRLGRFMLRVQRYEMLLKALVIDSVAFGTVETAPLNQQRRKDMFASKPMGYLFDEINRSYLRELGTQIPDEEEPQAAPDRPVFRARFALEMPAEELEQTKARLESFKRLRNRIVHHFLEDQDLFTQTGCERAIAVLEEGLATAQSSYEEIHQWAKTHWKPISTSRHSCRLPTSTISFTASCRTTQSTGRTAWLSRCCPAKRRPRLQGR